MKIRIVPLYAASLLIAAFLALPGCQKLNSKPKKAPHIIMLVADDLGLDVAPCHNDRVYMPFLQSRCETSLVYDRAYTHPYCTASRSAMMTGRHPYRTGASDVRYSARKLQLDEITFMEKIKAVSPHDYQMAGFGKWHLADDENGSLKNPNMQGFDYFEGTPRQKGTYHYYDYPWFVNGEPVGKQTEYRTTKITNSAISYFRNNAEDRPLLMSVNFTNPHLPYLLPPGALYSSPDIKPVKLKRSLNENPQPNQYYGNHREPRFDETYFAMLEALDTEISRLVKTLEAESARPVLFFFLGDNGSAAEVVQTQGRPVGEKAKATLYDLGTRVPLQVWSNPPLNGVKTSGRISQLVHLADLFPTLVRAAGGSPEDSIGFEKPIDGTSFYASIFEGAKGEPARQKIFVERGKTARLTLAYGAIDNQGRKLIVRETERRADYSPRIMEYYDTSNDPHEVNNLLDHICDVDAGPLFELLSFIEQKSEITPRTEHWYKKQFYRDMVADLQSACGP